MKALILGGAAALLFGGSALAQQDLPERLGDADGDSRISREEFLARHLQRFDAADADRDGTLTADEARAAFAARRDRFREAMFERLDADGDGAVSRAEFDAAGQARAGRGGARGHRRGGHRAGGWAELAADGLTRAEIQARAEAGFARLDANGDGYLTREDRAARGGARGPRGAR